MEDVCFDESNKMFLLPPLFMLPDSLIKTAAPLEIREMFGEKISRIKEIAPNQRYRSSYTKYFNHHMSNSSFNFKELFQMLYIKH